MQLTSEHIKQFINNEQTTSILCYHCGTACITSKITIEGHSFCCDGCKLVYEIINQNGLCDYYKLQSHPGLGQVKPLRSDKFAYLDNEEIAGKLYQFAANNNIIATFYIPSVHCSSCMWVLEHLSKLHQGIHSSRLNFTDKEVTIHFEKNKVSIRKIVELLATIGYEPYISLNKGDKKEATAFNKQRIYRLGIAGFCFGNVMMMSFPEYLSHVTGIDIQYAYLFRYLNLALAIPVFFYSANEFFTTALKGIRQKMLNIDAPIALAIIITFTRSVYEIISKTGSGYLDSMCGIVFFMLVGRIVQERTYKSMTFNRDYRSYFPIAVNVITTSGVKSMLLEDLKVQDIIEIHNDEVIPTDSMLLSGLALIDYSFVTGESQPIAVKKDEMIYAGGKQIGTEITVQIAKPVSGSYLTSLWNHYTFTKDKAKVNDAKSYIHILSKYFTWILFSIAICTGLYWAIHDPSKIMPAITAVLIVACPCALLLTSTFTNSNLLRIFSNNGLFLRDVTVIEQLAKIDDIVFDKTGTLTYSGSQCVTCAGHTLSEHEKDMLYSVVKSSKHPSSKAISLWLGARQPCSVSGWKETAGKGVNAIIDGHNIFVGSGNFVGRDKNCIKSEQASVYIRIDDKITSLYFKPVFRQAVNYIMPLLSKRYNLSLLSGDNDKQREALSAFFGNDRTLLFEQKPLDKLEYVEALQQKSRNVMMIGDGLNDAGALQQSNVGITFADDINNFTPSCDAILDAKKFSLLPSILRLARSSRYIIATSFFISIVYNIIGLTYAVQGKLNPMIAAILMPCSTLSIVLITTAFSSIIARTMGLTLRSE